MPPFWPFSDPPDRRVLTTRFVVEKGFPILLVSRDSHGEWEFLCGTTNKKKDAREILLGEVLDYDEGVAQVADLPVAWRAYRDAPGSPWLQAPLG